MVAIQRLLEASETDAAVREEADALESRYGHLEPELIIELAIDGFFPEQIAVVSSFGADSAVLLHLISEIDRTLPVIFLDTGKHFSESLDYRDSLVEAFALRDLRVIAPDKKQLNRQDADGTLHRRDPDACCALRKVEPMRRAVEPFKAWFTGRKRFQAAGRHRMPTFEAVDTRIRINPLARWTPADIASYASVHGLLSHPLVARGYLSIGCMPCTSPVQPGQHPRSGRWAGMEKTECGIHFGPSGEIVRNTATGAFGDG